MCFVYLDWVFGVIDRLKISIPFKAEFTASTYQTKKGESVSYIDIEECSRRGLKLEAGSVYFTGDDGEDKYEITELKHRVESVPTYFTGMA